MPKIKYTEDAKLAIVLEGLKSNGSVAELCRRHGISDSLYYRWRDAFVDGGKRALSGKLESPNTEMQSKLAEYEKVIGRLTVQNEVLKKRLPNLL